jgi:DNA-binding Xre family transcriptional regulator
LFQSPHKKQERAHRSNELNFRLDPPEFSAAARTRITAVEMESLDRCCRRLDELFGVTCSQSAESGSPVDFDLSQFFAPIMEYATDIYDAVAEGVFNVDIPNLDKVSYQATLSCFVFHIRDELLPKQFEEFRDNSGTWADHPITSAYYLLTSAWGIFDHPLYEELDAGMREAFKSIDVSDDDWGSVAHEDWGSKLWCSLRKRLSSRIMYWMAKAEVGATEIFAAAEKQEGLVTPTQTDSITANRETPAQVIDRFRSKKGWTMEGLAAQAHMDIKQLYKVKRGDSVRSETTGKLAAALGCLPGDLIPITPRP